MSSLFEEVTISEVPMKRIGKSVVSEDYMFRMRLAEEFAASGCDIVRVSEGSDGPFETGMDASRFAANLNNLLHSKNFNAKAFVRGTDVYLAKEEKWRSIQ